MLLSMLDTTMIRHNLSINRRATFAFLILHQLKLLIQLLIHQTSYESSLLISCRLRYIHTIRWTIELLRIMWPSIARCSSKFREVTTNTSTTCSSDLNWVCSLLWFPGIWCNGWSVLHRGLMRCLRFFSCLDDIKIVLILSAGIRILGRVQNLFLSLKLLLEHNLRLLLVCARPSVLQGLRVSASTSITLKSLRSSCRAPIILRWLIANNLVFQFNNVTGFRCWRHRHYSVLGRARRSLMRR